MSTSFPIVTVSFRKRSVWSDMSNRAVTDGDDGLSEMGASVVTDANSGSGGKTVKTVWDFERIEKKGGPDNASKFWRCGWCGLTLRGWNATKALN